MRAAWVLIGALACKSEVEPGPEPLDLPSDPSATGVPVGVRTVAWGDLTVEVWYPASDTTEGPGESIDFTAWIPDSVGDLLGDVRVPLVPTVARRDAPLRVPEAPYPALVFSHGFGGNRVQSVDLTTHLASRGYVVVATDHVGRSMTDLLPCLFSPPAAGCNLAPEDPGGPDVDALVGFLDDAAERGFLADAVDTGRLGILGHSAGGGTTTSVLAANDRFAAGLPMAGGAAVARDVPNLMLAGDCDGIVGYDGLVDAVAGSVDGSLVTIAGAGHLAFSDLCEIDLAALYDEHLAPRDDVNATFAELFLGLGVDGCPGHVPDPATCATDWLPIETSDPIVRHYATVFFDQELLGRGPGPVPGVFPEATLTP